MKYDVNDRIGRNDLIEHPIFARLSNSNGILISTYMVDENSIISNNTINT